MLCRYLTGGRDYNVSVMTIL